MKRKSVVGKRGNKSKIDRSAGRDEHPSPRTAASGRIEMIHLTKAASSQVKKLMEEHELIGHALRVAVSAGGCSGYSYTIDIVEEVEANDLNFESEGVKIVCDARSLRLLEGLEIDYESSLMSGGFKFNNPNAKKSCGCGTSFSC